MPIDLPITPLLPAIVASLATHPRLVLEAPPGAGKTTRVAPALLDAAWMQPTHRILMLEPRRVAARAAAGFMASERGEAVGETIGFCIRAERRVSARTRIEVVTEGILTRLLQEDPTLEGIGAILFDEFHERHLHADLGLALSLDVQQSIRPDLRIVLMSATLDSLRLAQWLDAPRLTSESRAFPVHIAHWPGVRDETLAASVRRACTHALATHPGDLLVFLPGARAINDAMRALEPIVRDAPASLRVIALHGELPVEQQSAALMPDPDGKRRIVLATNVAESSVTLPGTRVVIDAGLAREPRTDPNSGFSRLVTVAIAQDSATQRAGRAGRVAEGWCYRLWPASKRLAAERKPEIETADLAGFALELAAWGSGELRFLTPPPPGALAAARDLLHSLELLDAQHRITALGRRALATGAQPRIAAMLIAAGEGEARALACDLAALLDARDPLRDAGDDLPARWRALAAHRKLRSARGAWAAIDRESAQWRRRAETRVAPPDSIAAHALGLLLARAFPDRIARAHPGDAQRYQLASGRSATLFPDSAWRGEPWLALVELADATGDARILRAAPLAESDLRAAFPQRFTRDEHAEWDDARGALRAEKLECFDRIVLARAPSRAPDARASALALAAAFQRRGIDSLPWTDRLRQWRERVRCVADWFPEETWPTLDDASLLPPPQGNAAVATSSAPLRAAGGGVADAAARGREAQPQWLLAALVGTTRLDAFSAEAFGHALRGLLDFAQQRRLDERAPTQLRVPSGLERPVIYAQGHPPVLACKVQELFGLADTPRVGEGRAPVTLHLLSPGGRPLQVTQDLRGFWDRTWPEVRREMLGRYPRHPWPIDPWTAPPTHRAKARSR